MTQAKLLQSAQDTLCLTGVFQAEGVAQLDFPVLMHGQTLVLDLSHVQIFDSSLLAWIVACKEQAYSVQARLLLKEASPALQQLMALYGLTELLMGEP